MSADAPRVAAVAAATSGAEGHGELRRWLWSFIRPELPAFAAVLLLSILAVLAGLAQPYLTKALIDHGIVAHDRTAILALGSWMAGLAVLALVVGFVCRRIHVAASARLLHRHFAPTRRTIRLGGVNVSELDSAVLRRNVVVVAQEQAARAAGVLEFADRLPHGRNTALGPRGATLSGGERQRGRLHVPS